MLKRISELEVSIGQLERRATTLWSQTFETVWERQHQKVAFQAMRRANDIKNFKLRKAQMLNHFLQNEVKRLDKHVFLAYMERFNSL